MRIAIVGGTGREGRGLAIRWSRAGHRVFIGSRDAARAGERARELTIAAGETIGGGDNEWAVAEAEVAVLAVPYAAHAETVHALAGSLEGRVVVDITVPLRPPSVTQVHLALGQSAALEAQAILGSRAPVVATLHHVSSSHLADPNHRFESDALVCADDDRAREVGMRLVGDLGIRALDAGPLRNAIALESMTPVLLHLTRRYGSKGAGVRIVGIGAGTDAATRVARA